MQFHAIETHCFPVSTSFPVSAMRWFTVAALIFCLSTTLFAHHPDKENHRVHPRIDLIGPLGTWLPPSYRRRYNRPSNVAGKISYYIAPSSLEAMSWHAATHRNAYKDHKPRTVMHYFYPKPWQALQIGPRPNSLHISDVNQVPSVLPASQSGETLQDVLQKDDNTLDQLQNLQDDGSSPSDEQLLPPVTGDPNLGSQLIESDQISPTGVQTPADSE